MFLFERNYNALTIDDDSSINYKRAEMTGQLNGLLQLRVMANKFAMTAGIDVDFDDETQFFADKKEISNHTHSLAVLYYKDPMNNNPAYGTHIWVFDYNHATDEYTFGQLMGNYFDDDTHKYFSISKPMIQFIESCNFPVFTAQYTFNTEYFDRNVPINAKSCVDHYMYIKDENSMFVNIKVETGFFRQMKLAGIWYNKLPIADSRTKFIKNFSDEFKLSKDFVKNFAGIQNKAGNNTYYNKTTNCRAKIYTHMFDSLEDFAKVAKLYIDKGYDVIDEQCKIYNKDNYQELLNFTDMYNQQAENSNVESDINQEMTESDKKSKELLIPYIGTQACDNFEFLNNTYYRKDKLTVNDFASQRSGNDIYRKFDWPVIIEFLKNNGIDIDKIIDESHEKSINMAKEVLDNFFNEDIEKIEKRLGYYGGISNLSKYLVRTELFNFKSDKLIDTISDEFIPSGYQTINDLENDEIENSNSDDKRLIGMVFNAARNKSVNSMYDSLECNTEHLLLLRRFICLLIKYLYEYNIQEIIDDKSFNYDNSEESHNDAMKSWIKRNCKSNTYNDVRRNLNMYITLNNNDVIVSENIITQYPDSKYETHHGTSPKECVYSLSSYTRLYGFYYCLAKALKNAYHITVINPCSHNFNIEKELGYNDEPNMQSVNFSAINTMIQTILSNMIKSEKAKEKRQLSKKILK